MADEYQRTSPKPSTNWGGKVAGAGQWSPTPADQGPPMPKAKTVPSPSQQSVVARAGGVPKGTMFTKQGQAAAAKANVAAKGAAPIAKVAGKPAPKPITLKDRVRRAFKSQAFAKQRADKLAAKAKAMADAGDPRAAKMQGIADKATANLASVNAKVDKVMGAVKKKADHLGASMAEDAARMVYLKRGLADRQPGGKLEGDAKNKEWYAKEVAKSEAKAKANQVKSDKFEGNYSGPQGQPNAGAMVMTSAEKFGQDIIKKQEARHKEDPYNNEPPPKAEEMNVAIGLPPGGMKEIDAINEESMKRHAEDMAWIETGKKPSKGQPAAQAQQPPPTQAAPKAAPTQNSSKLGGTKQEMAGGAPQQGKPSLKKGDQGGMYYETKGGNKVYVAQ